MSKPEIIMAPGPVPVPPEVLLAQGSPIMYHRGPGYGQMLTDVTQKLQTLYRTTNDVLLFASSGTGGLEAAVVNCFSPGDRIVVPVAGYFGERFAKIGTAFGLQVRSIDYEWGQTVDPADVAAAIAEAPTKGVLVQQSETSTGVIHDIEAIAAVVRDTDALMIVDAVSSVGAVPLETDGWGVDVAVGGSQKALSASPGLSFMAVSPAAWAAHAEAKLPRFYWDWTATKKSFDLDPPENPYTPAVHLVMGLNAALDLYMEEGPDNVLQRSEMLSRAVKEGATALGLDLFGVHPERAWTVTAIAAPEGIDGNALVAKLRTDHGIIIGPGQGPLKGKVFRIGHLGYYDKFDIIRCLAALEMTLDSMGYPVKRGSAVAAAENVFVGE